MRADGLGTAGARCHSGEQARVALDRVGGDRIREDEDGASAELPCGQGLPKARGGRPRKKICSCRLRLQAASGSKFVLKNVPTIIFTSLFCAK